MIDIFSVLPFSIVLFAWTCISLAGPHPHGQPPKSQNKTTIEQGGGEPGTTIGFNIQLLPRIPRENGSDSDECLLRTLLKIARNPSLRRSNPLWQKPRRGPC